jgi:hypothetical protein
MSKVKIELDGKKVLSMIPRMFDNTVCGLLGEVVQNARRSDAKNVWIDCVTHNEIIVSNDGNSIGDFQKLFSVGKSGWSENRNGEDPAGMGVFSSNICNKVSIRSYNSNGDKCTSVTFTGDILKNLGHELEVKDKFYPKNHEDANVEYYLKGIKEPLFSELSSKFDACPINVWCKNKDSVKYMKVNYELEINKIAYRKLINNVEIIFYTGRIPNTSGGVIVLYHGDKAYLEIAKEPRYPIYTSRYMPIGVSSIIVRTVEQLDSGVRMVLPSRNTMVKNKAYYDLITEIYRMMGEYTISKNGGDHCFSYNLYLKVKEVVPELPECCIPSKYISSELCISKALDVDQRTIEILSNSTNIPMPLSNDKHYKGYMWYDKMMQVTEIEIYADDELVGDTTGAKWDEFVQAKKIKLVFNQTLTIDNVDTAILVDQNCSDEGFSISYVPGDNDKQDFGTIIDLIMEGFEYNGGDMSYEEAYDSYKELWQERLREYFSNTVGLNAINDIVADHMAHYANGVIYTPYDYSYVLAAHPIYSLPDTVLMLPKSEEIRDAETLKKKLDILQQSEEGIKMLELFCDLCSAAQTKEKK